MVDQCMFVVAIAYSGMPLSSDRRTLPQVTASSSGPTPVLPPSLPGLPLALHGAPPGLNQAPVNFYHVSCGCVSELPGKTWRADLRDDCVTIKEHRKAVQEGHANELQRNWLKVHLPSLGIADSSSCVKHVAHWRLRTLLCPMPPAGEGHRGSWHIYSPESPVLQF